MLEIGEDGRPLHGSKTQNQTTELDHLVPRDVKSRSQPCGAPKISAGEVGTDLSFGHILVLGAKHRESHRRTWRPSCGIINDATGPDGNGRAMEDAYTPSPT